jgi:hypothetical protein
MRKTRKMQNEDIKTIFINQMIIIKKKIIFPIYLTLLFLLILSSTGIAGAGKAIADGTFVQAELCGSWSDARWQQEFKVMKEAGMHYLIIGAVAESREGEKAKMLYPSALPNTELNGIVKGNDMVDMCLRNAEAAGIKVFIGVGMNEKWWDAPHVDSTWLYNQMEFDNKVCDEVWALYKNKYPSAFYGWYWVYEVANVNLNQVQQDVLIHAMNIQLDHLISKHEKLPFMWCPFMNTEFGGPEAYKLMWQYVFAGIHTTPGDIFAPQDCVGAGGLKLNEVAAWFAALGEAVATKPGLKYWSDVETFDHIDWSPATIDRFVSQMQLEQPYVENFITFAYSHYNSPYNTDPGYHATYMDYIKNGSLETIPPTVPSQFKAALQANGEVMLNWNESADNIGVCGYYIYRDGIKISKRQERRKHHNNKIESLLTSYTDRGLNSDSAYTYQVQAYDFANNVSALTAPVTINTSSKGKSTK